MVKWEALMKRIRKQVSYTSREIAKTRAGLTVAADRMDCSPELFSQMRHELYGILSKYINTDDDNVRIQLTFFYRMKRGISDAKTIQIK